jgi:hypothetical protein
MSKGRAARCGLYNMLRWENYDQGAAFRLPLGQVGPTLSNSHHSGERSNLGGPGCIEACRSSGASVKRKGAPRTIFCVRCVVHDEKFNSNVVHDKEFVAQDTLCVVTTHERVT